MQGTVSRRPLPSTTLALVAGVLVLLAAFAWQGWQMYGISQGRFLDDTALKVMPRATQSSGLSLADAAEQHLFGNPEEKPVAAPPAVMPVTDLKIVLVGAITDNDPQKASALIGSTQGVKRYFVGDTIPGNATLQAVHADSVILKRDERFETLSFPKGSDTPTGGTPAARVMPEPSRVRPEMPSAAPQAAPHRPAGGGMGAGGGTRQLMPLSERLKKN